MNEYRIEHRNGYPVKVIVRTAAEARRWFKERIGSLDLIESIELIREDAPATKEQEREALEAIRKRVAELGPNSYVGTALKGCFEIAEGNIEDDFADNPLERWELARDEVKRLRAEVQEKNRQIDALNAQLESNAAAGNWNAEQAGAYHAAAKEAEHRAEAAEAEIMRLKARLYDLLIEKA